MPQDKQKSILQASSNGINHRPLPTPVGWYRRGGKRLVDIVLSGLGLALLTPLFMVLAILTKITSPGPAFFRQRRVGKDGQVFLIVKFRSMVSFTAEPAAPITAATDPRITAWGAFLRRHKIDELPQLWNVLKGDMSLVGPRPELEIYVQSYTSRQRRVLQVRPGITDAASLAFRDEEKLLAASGAPEPYYREKILPAKLASNLHYIENYDFFQDLLLIFKTVQSVFWNPVQSTNLKPCA